MRANRKTAAAGFALDLRAVGLPNLGHRGKLRGDLLHLLGPLRQRLGPALGGAVFDALRQTPGVTLGKAGFLGAFGNELGLGTARRPGFPWPEPRPRLESRRLPPQVAQVQDHRVTDQRRAALLFKNGHGGQL